MTLKREEGTPAPMRSATRVVTGGRDPFAQHGYINPPVYHASTLLYRSAEDYLARHEAPAPLRRLVAEMANGATPDGRRRTVAQS